MAFSSELEKLERRWQENRTPQQIEWYAAQFPRMGSVNELPVDFLVPASVAAYIDEHHLYRS